MDRKHGSLSSHRAHGGCGKSLIKSQHRVSGGCDDHRDVAVHGGCDDHRDLAVRGGCDEHRESTPSSTLVRLRRAPSEWGAPSALVRLRRAPSEWGAPSALVRLRRASSEEWRAQAARPRNQAARPRNQAARPRNQAAQLVEGRRRVLFPRGIQNREGPAQQKSPTVIEEYGPSTREVMYISVLQTLSHNGNRGTPGTAGDTRQSFWSVQCDDRPPERFPERASSERGG